MNTIVVCIDFSKSSHTVLDAAVAQAKAIDAKLVCVHAITELDEDQAWLLLLETPEELLTRVKNSRTAHLKAMCQESVDATFDQEYMELRVETGKAVDVILQVADEVDADLVVAGASHRSAIAQVFLGSTANQLVRECTHPVLIVPPLSTGFETMEHPRILVPLDFSEVSHAVLKQAAKLARHRDAKLVLIHAIQTPPVWMGEVYAPVSLATQEFHEVLKERRQWLDDAVQSLGFADVVDSAHVLPGEPSDVIRQSAKELNTSLICMGTHGRRGLRRFLLGNTAERMLRDLPCPILVLHQNEEMTSTLGALTPRPS